MIHNEATMKVKGNTIEYKGYEVSMDCYVDKGYAHIYFYAHIQNNIEKDFKELEQAITWIDEQGVKSEGD